MRGRGWRTAFPVSSQVPLLHLKAVLAVGSSGPFLRKLLFRPWQDLPCGPSSKCSVSFTPDMAEPDSPRLHCLGLLLSRYWQLVPATPRPDPCPSSCCLSFQAQTGGGEEAQRESHSWSVPGQASVRAPGSCSQPGPCLWRGLVFPVPCSPPAARPLYEWILVVISARTLDGVARALPLRPDLIAPFFLLPWFSDCGLLQGLPSP